MASFVDDRPRLKLFLLPLETMLIGLSFALLSAHVLMVSRVFRELPPRIPLKFGFQGQPIAWGSAHSIWTIPGLAIGMMVLFLALFTVPHVHNYPWDVTEKNAERLYRLSRKFLLLMLVFIQSVLIFCTSSVVNVAQHGGDGIGIGQIITIIAGTPVLLAYYFISGSKIAE